MLRLNRRLSVSLVALLSLSSITGADAQGLPDIGHAIGGFFHQGPSSNDSGKAAQNGALACAGGGVIGGFIGSRLGRHNPLSTIFGAAGGCLIASAVAHELSAHEQEELATRTQASFDGSAARTTYYSSENHKEVTISRGEEVEQRRDVEIGTLDGVKAPEGGDFVVIGRPYYAKSAVRLHSAPDVNAPTVGGFRAGESVMIMGRTRDGVWNVVGANQTLVGYSAANLFSAKRAVAAKKKTVHRTHDAASETQTSATGVQTATPQLDNGLALENQKVTKTKVAADTTCAQAEQKVGSASGSVTGCKSPYGGWNVI